MVGRILADVGVRRLDPEGIARRAASSAASQAVPSASVTGIVVPPGLTDRPMAARVGGLVGRGDGLTPAGDDLLCGWLATHRAAGVATPDVDRAIRSHLPRTTLLSATLLDCALHGESVPEFLAFLDALGTSEEDAATRALYAVGHSSGVALAQGARLALSALRNQIGSVA